MSLLATLLCTGAAAAQPNKSSDADVRVAGPGKRPDLIFACCDQGAESLKTVLGDPAVVADLKDLHAGLAVALDDLSPLRAQIVQQLNEAGIPTIAWLVLPRDQGYYVNASNAPQAAARFAQFEQWTQANHLRWDAVGLDIEPNFEEFKGSKAHIFWMLVRRSFGGERVRKAKAEYSALIRQIQAAGYPVQTYQMTFLADERKAHSTLLERLFGMVDVRGNQEVLMAYSSFNHRAGAAAVWSYGQDAQALAVGSTLSTGNAQMDAKYGPLNWEEFSRDVIVASHFSSTVGVYSLEGCVRQGFLPRLKSMDWNQSVTIPGASVEGVHRFRLMVQAILWTVSHFFYFLTAFLILVVWFIRWRVRKKRAAQTSAAGA